MSDHIEQPTVVGVVPENPTAAYMLETYQEQLDSDGISVGVSRQALDEVLERFAQLQAHNKELCDALTISRGQWIHSVNAKQCLVALGENK